MPVIILAADVSSSDVHGFVRVQDSVAGYKKEVAELREVQHAMESSVTGLRV